VKVPSGLHAGRLTLLPLRLIRRSWIYAVRSLRAREDLKVVIQVKLISAVLKPGQFDEVVQAAIGGGAQGLTAAEVRGFGQQHQSPVEPIVPCGRDSLLVPKLRVDMVVADDTVPSLVEAIANAINMGGIGGGEIWVSAVESVLRVRTGERDHKAV
jgi:nitrogen regulatory protein PII